MTEICVLCLSKDRNLFLIDESQWTIFFWSLEQDDAQYIKYLQTELLLRVCWECRARVRSMSLFVKQSQRAVTLLRKYWASPSENFPPSQSRLTVTKQDIIDYPSLDLSLAELKSFGKCDVQPIEAKEVKVEFQIQAPGPSAIKTELDTEIQVQDDIDYSSMDSPPNNIESVKVKSKRKTSKSKVTKRKNNKQTYTTLFLTTEQAEKLYRDERNMEKADNNSNVCDVCDRSFANDKDLREHEACHEETAGNLICNICKSRFANEKSLKEHIETHFVLYKCKECDYECRTLKDMKKHAKYVHLKEKDDSDIENRDKKHECKKCKNCFDTIILLRKHRVKCNVFKCDFCEKTFTHRTSKYSHMDLHHKPLPEVECKICKKKFKNKYAIKSHLQKHRKEAKGQLYYCDVCQIDYKTAIKFRHHFFKNMTPGNEHLNECYHCATKHQTPKLLHEHITSTHMRRAEHKCSHCYKCYTQPERLTAHMLDKHTAVSDKLRDKMCHVCGKGFTSSTILQNHLRSHTGERPFKCSLCSARFGHTGSLYTHGKLVHKKRAHGRFSCPLYPCPECNKEFVSESRLKSHYDFFHLKKSEFTCDICNKIFISAWNLKNHKTMLHGINRTRSFPCNICGKEFFRVDALKSHKLIHSEERTFMCSECGKTFKQQAALYTHNKLVHKGIKRAPAKSKRGKKTEVETS